MSRQTINFSGMRLVIFSMPWALGGRGSDQDLSILSTAISFTHDASDLII
jgi:hypothetical protein